jgi:hypothetical protein
MIAMCGAAALLPYGHQALHGLDIQVSHHDQLQLLIHDINDARLQRSVVVNL